jgi:hypothetical protein
MAPVLAGFILCFRKKYILGGILSAVALSLEFYANHPQITYYMVMVALILGICELIQAIRAKAFGPYFAALGVISVAAAFALLTNITVLWATYEYGNYTIRGKSELTSGAANRTSGLDKDYATNWSYGVGETMTLLIPNIYGGGDLKPGDNSAIAKALRGNNVPEENVRQFVNQPIPMYWGAQPFTSGPVYVGAIICFLFILGLMIVKGPLKWWLLVATVLSVMLAWGHNFMSLTDFFFSYFPGYNKFRAITMILVIAEFAMPLLGILALKAIFESKEDPKKIMKKIFIAAGITGGIALVFALLPGIFLDFSGQNDAEMAKQYQFPDWLMQALRDDRESLVRMDSFRTLIFILLSGGTLILFLYGKLKKNYVYLIIAALILIDMFPVAKRYMGNDNFTSSSKVTNPIEASPADEQILQDKSPDYRVFNATVSTFRDATTSYFHKSIGGYHGAKLRRYQELIENQISKNNMAVLNMLNTKYFIVPDDKHNPVAQMNPGALGNAWFVKAIKLVDNADAELKALTNFNPRDTAIVDKRFAEEIKGYIQGRDTSDVIRLDQYAPNDLQYSYKTKNNGFAVFSEIYYPKGWNAYLDGKLTPHFWCDYVLRAMILPAGEHKVEFRFEPKVYVTGEKISLASSVVLILLVLGFGAFEVWKRVRSAS